MTSALARAAVLTCMSPYRENFEGSQGMIVSRGAAPHRVCPRLHPPTDAPPLPGFKADCALASQLAITFADAALPNAGGAWGPLFACKDVAASLSSFGGTSFAASYYSADASGPATSLGELNTTAALVFAAPCPGGCGRCWSLRLCSCAPPAITPRASQHTACGPSCHEHHFLTH